MMNDFKDIKVAVAGTGYVGLSIAMLLSQHHHVTAVDVIHEKVEKLNNKIFPILDDYIEKYLAEKSLNLVATLDGKSAYKYAEVKESIPWQRAPRSSSTNLTWKWVALFSAVELRITSKPSMHRAMPS